MIWDVKQAVILAGGSGKRLMPFTKDRPKPMVIVDDFPFLDYLIHSILQIGIKKILILTGYKSKIIEQRYKKISNNYGLEIDFSIGKVNDRTGRRVLNAKEKLNDNFLLMYGDNYWPIEFNRMIDFANKTNSQAYTTVYNNLDGSGEYGFQNNIHINDQGLVIKYDKQMESSALNGVDIGYFLINKKSLNFNVTDNISFEEDIITEYVSKSKLSAYRTNQKYYYITNIKTLNKFRDFVVTKNIKSLHKHFFEE